ncbi:hypothetical protein J5N97_011965 [Dioscorea zingiberensis]|uniref:Uncharacterized protein n=1 Tax=Dioscorea zingiberensis TaxID=325984 RepID=A0A9D5D428_9LILI|nr:hypothetical protein J5N97_011965 [Dioscorea zingiberensis]
MPMRSTLWTAQSYNSCDPGQYVVPNHGHIVIGLPEQQGVHHALIDLDGLILAPRPLVERLTDAGIGDDIGASVKHEEGEANLEELGAQVVGDPQQLQHGPKPGPSSVPQRVAGGDDPLLLDLDRLVHQVSGGDDRQRGQKFGDEGEDLGDGPSRPDVIGDLAHGGGQDGPVPPSGQVAKVDEEADGAAHGLAIEEAGEVSVFGATPDGVEVRDAVLDDGVNVGDESAEALGRPWPGRSRAKQEKEERARKIGVDWKVQEVSLP